MLAVLAFIVSHWHMIATALASSIALASLVVGMLPLSASKRSAIVRGLAFASAVVHSDALGTFKMPFTFHGSALAGVDMQAMLADFSLIEAAFRQAQAASNTATILAPAGARAGGSK